MSNEFILIPLTNENFENITSIPVETFVEPFRSIKLPDVVNNDNDAKTKIINNLAKMCKIITDGSEKSMLQVFKNVLISLNITIPSHFLPYFNGEGENPSLLDEKNLVLAVNFLLDINQEFINQRNICLDSINKDVKAAIKSDRSQKLFNFNLNLPNQNLQEIVENTIKSTCTNQKMLCPMIAMSDTAFKSHLSFGQFIVTSMFRGGSSLNDIIQTIQIPSFNQRWFFVITELIKNMEVIIFVMFFLYMYMNVNPLDNYFGISIDRIHLGPLVLMKEIKKYLDENFINPLISEICSDSDCSFIYNYLVTVIKTLMSRNGYDSFKREERNINTLLNNKNFKNRVIKMFKMNYNTVTSFVNFYNNIFNILNDNNAMALIGKVADLNKEGIQVNYMLLEKLNAELFYTYMLPVFESLVNDLNTNAVKSQTIAPSFAPTIAPSFAPTIAPSFAPTIAPSFAPTIAPSFAPSFAPSLSPRIAPRIAPSPSPEDENLCSSNSLNIAGVCVSYQNLGIGIGVVLLLIGIYMSMNTSRSSDDE